VKVLINSSLDKEVLFPLVKILTRFYLSTWAYSSLISILAYIVDHFLFKVPNLSMYFSIVLHGSDITHS
jgi:hypothetical protein